MAVSTLGLIFVGGLVTSTESGLAVPDWPLSYGTLFPPMVGGILYEHGHRMVAATVGFLTIALALWLWRVEPRKWVRRIGLLALATVIIQGSLGGITVLFLLPTAVSVSHAATAQLFLCLTVSIAVLTSHGWLREGPRLSDPGAPSVRLLTAATTGIIYTQTILGALMRHTQSGLAIPDYPLSFGHLVPPTFTPQILVNFLHRTWALVVAGFVIWAASRILRGYRAERGLRLPAVVLLCALVGQITLGALTVWTAKSVVLTTLHVAGGAFTLAASLVLTMRTHRAVLPKISRSAPEPALSSAAVE
jgi:cytochrome c oxidase assembly protein subunit 15